MNKFVQNTFWMVFFNVVVSAPAFAADNNLNITVNLGDNMTRVWMSPQCSLGGDSHDVVLLTSHSERRTSLNYSKEKGNGCLFVSFEAGEDCKSTLTIPVSPANNPAIRTGEYPYTGTACPTKTVIATVSKSGDNGYDLTFKAEARK